MRREKRFCNHGIDMKDDSGLKVYVPHYVQNQNAHYVVWNKMTSCLVMYQYFGSNTRLNFFFVRMSHRKMLLGLLETSVRCFVSNRNGYCVERKQLMMEL